MAPICTECCSVGRQKRGAVYALGWSKDGRRLVSASNDGRYTTWSGLDMTHLQTMSIHEAQVNAVCWLKDGTSFISGDAEGNIYYFEWTMTLLRKIQGTHHGQGVQSLSVAPATVNAHFASGGDDKAVRVWNWAR